MNAPRFPKLAVAVAALTSLVYTEITAQTETTPAVTPSTTAIVAAKPQGVTPMSSGAEDILKLTRAKVAEEVIVVFIQTSGRRYNLSASEIISLREAGVTDRVLTTMLGQNLQPVTQPSPTEPPAAVAPAPTPPAESPTDSSSETFAAAPSTSVVQTAPYSTVYYVPDTAYYYYPYSWCYTPYWSASYWYPAYWYPTYYYYPYWSCWWYPWSFGFAFYWGDCSNDYHHGGKYYAGHPPHNQGHHGGSGGSGSPPDGSNSGGRQSPAARGTPSPSGGSTTRPTPSSGDPITFANNSSGQASSPRTAANSSISAQTAPSLNRGNSTAIAGNDGGGSGTVRPAGSSTSRPTPSSVWGKNSETVPSRSPASSVAVAPSRPNLNRGNPTDGVSAASPSTSTASRPVPTSVWGSKATQNATARATQVSSATAATHPNLDRGNPATTWNTSRGQAVTPRFSPSTTVQSRPSLGRSSAPTTWSTIGSRNTYRPSVNQKGSPSAFSRQRSVVRASSFQSVAPRSSNFSRPSAASAPSFRSGGSSASFRGFRGSGGSVSRPSMSSGGFSRGGGGGGRRH